jgi:hypothetical protein
MWGYIDTDVPQPDNQITTNAVVASGADHIINESIDAPAVVEPPADRNSTTNIDLGYAIVVGADGHDIQLVHNVYATDKTYNEVRDFILRDGTDRTPYVTDVYTCGDYAEDVQNNAELAGIKCGYVCIDFDDGSGHACNYFDTTDKGRVYIDCTIYDSVSEIKIGKLYQPMYIASYNDMEHSHTINSMGVVSKYSETDDLGVTIPHL